MKFVILWLSFLATGEIEWDLTTEKDSLFKHLMQL